MHKLFHILSVVILLLAGTVHRCSCMDSMVVIGAGEWAVYKYNSSMSVIALATASNSYEKQVLISFFIPSSDYFIDRTLAKQILQDTEKTLNNACKISQVGTIEFTHVNCTFSDVPFTASIYVAVLLRTNVKLSDYDSLISYAITGSDYDSGGNQGGVIVQMDNSNQPEIKIGLRKESAIIYNQGRSYTMTFHPVNNGIFDATKVVVRYLTSPEVPFVSVEDKRKACNLVSNVEVRCTYERLRNEMQGDTSGTLKLQVPQNTPLGVYRLTWELSYAESEEVRFGMLSLPVRAIPKEFNVCQPVLFLNRAVYEVFEYGQIANVTVTLIANYYEFKKGEMLVTVPQGLAFLGSDSGCELHQSLHPFVICDVHIPAGASKLVTLQFLVTSKDAFKSISPMIYFWSENEQNSTAFDDENIPKDMYTIDNFVIVDNLRDNRFEASINIGTSVLVVDSTTQVYFKVINRGPLPVSGVIHITIPDEISVTSVDFKCEHQNSRLKCPVHSIQSGATLLIKANIKSDFIQDSGKQNSLKTITLEGEFMSEQRIYKPVYAVQGFAVSYSKV